MPALRGEDFGERFSEQEQLEFIWPVKKIREMGQISALSDGCS